MAFIIVDAGQPRSRSMWITWPEACTPVSVRPAALTRAASPEKAAMARSREACTEGCPAWAWKPW